MEKVAFSMRHCNGTSEGKSAKTLTEDKKTWWVQITHFTAGQKGCSMISESSSRCLPTSSKGNNEQVKVLLIRKPVSQLRGDVYGHLSSNFTVRSESVISSRHRFQSRSLQDSRNKNRQHPEGEDDVIKDPEEPPMLPEVAGTSSDDFWNQKRMKLIPPQWNSRKCYLSWQGRKHLNSRLVIPMVVMDEPDIPQSRIAILTGPATLMYIHEHFLT